jgi:hypothetical protein
MVYDDTQPPQQQRRQRQQQQRQRHHCVSVVDPWYFDASSASRAGGRTHFQQDATTAG